MPFSKAIFRGSPQAVAGLACRLDLFNGRITTRRLSPSPTLAVRMPGTPLKLKWINLLSLGFIGAKDMLLPVRFTASALCLAMEMSFSSLFAR